MPVIDTRSGGNGKSDRKEMKERAQKECDAEEFPVLFLKATGLCG